MSKVKELGARAKRKIMRGKNIHHAMRGWPRMGIT